jgi:hypothetical protein
MHKAAVAGVGSNAMLTLVAVAASYLSYRDDQAARVFTTCL